MKPEQQGWLLRNSLWLVSAGLMLASSGLDGAYMARFMAPTWLGYVLNTISDISSEALMYYFGRLRLYPKNQKRYHLALLLLPVELLTAAYAWLFSWRQLLIVLPAVEGVATKWVAPIVAGFIPLLLAAIGLAQALLAGRISDAPVTQTVAEVGQDAEHGTQSEVQVTRNRRKSNGHAPHICPFCGADANASGKHFANKQAVSAHLRFCDAYQSQHAAQSAQSSPQAVTEAAQKGE